MDMLDDFKRINPWIEAPYGDWDNRKKFLASRELDNIMNRLGWIRYDEIMDVLMPGNSGDDPDGGWYRHAARRFTWEFAEVKVEDIVDDRFF